MSFFKRLFGRTPEKLAAKAQSYAQQEAWLDARLACNDALEDLSADSPLRGEIQATLDTANEQIALEHLEAAEAYVDIGDSQKASERAGLARDLAVSKKSQERSADLLRALAGGRSTKEAPEEKHMIDSDQDLADDAATDQEQEALFEAQGERAELYREKGDEMGEALRAAAEGELTTARDILLKLNKKTPKDPIVAFELGHVLHALGNRSDAARLLRAAVAGDAGRVEAVLELAEVSLALGHRKGAIETLEKFTGEDSRITQRLGEVLIVTDQLDKAQTVLEASLGTNAEAPPIYRLLGDVAERKEEYKEAGRLYEIAFTKAPQDALSALWLARFLGSHGDDSIRAIEIYNGLADRDDSGRFMYFRLIGEQYLKLGHIDEAIDLLEKARNLTPPQRTQDVKAVEELIEKAYAEDEE